MRRRVLRIFLLLAIAYAALCALLWFAQDAILFHPSKLAVADWRRRVEGAGAVSIALERGGETVYGYLRPGRAGEAAPTLLYFGGNGERVWARLRQAMPDGWGFASVAYRGYGPSTGSPSSAAILGDAVAFFDALVARPEVDRARVVTWGTSLGTGVAVHVAAERPVMGVVLLAPYDRLSSVGQDRYPWVPVALLFRHDIAPADRAPAIDVPLLAWHGGADRVIPIERGRALKERWKGEVTWMEMEGAGHNDLERSGFRAALCTFLDGLEP